MMTRDPFDIAPHAHRHMRASWLVLAIGLLFAASCALSLGRSLQRMRYAEQANQAKRQALRAQVENDAAVRLNHNDPIFLGKIKAQQRLQQILRMSWAGLFDALELAGKEVDGEATVLSLIPVSTRADAAQVEITALAVSTQMMLDYLRALEKNTHVRDAQLSMQQPAVNAGGEVIRFQLSVLWDPRGEVSGQASGQAKRADSAGHIK